LNHQLAAEARIYETPISYTADVRRVKRSASRRSASVLINLRTRHERHLRSPGRVLHTLPAPPFQPVMAGHTPYVGTGLRSAGSQLTRCWPRGAPCTCYDIDEEHLARLRVRFQHRQICAWPVATWRARISKACRIVDTVIASTCWRCGRRSGRWRYPPHAGFRRQSCYSGTQINASLSFGCRPSHYRRYAREELREKMERPVSRGSHSGVQPHHAPGCTCMARCWPATSALGNEGFHSLCGSARSTTAAVAGNLLIAIGVKAEDVVYKTTI